MKVDRIFRVWVVANIFLIGAFTFLFISISIPAMIPCTDPLAQDLLLALCVSLIIYVIVTQKIFHVYSNPVLFVYLIIAMSTLWLGSYPSSPLGFSSGRILVLRGFIVTRSARPPIDIKAGGTMTVASHSITEIRSITLPVDETCHWVSKNGGEFDDPTNCEAAYQAPQEANDVLKLLVQPSCKLPDALGEIRVNILP